jgi:hypothetical protein
MNTNKLLKDCLCKRINGKPKLYTSVRWQASTYYIAVFAFLISIVIIAVGMVCQLIPVVHYVYAVSFTIAIISIIVSILLKANSYTNEAGNRASHLCARIEKIMLDGDTYHYTIKNIGKENIAKATIHNVKINSATPKCEPVINCLPVNSDAEVDISIDCEDAKTLNLEYEIHIYSGKALLRLCYEQTMELCNNENAETSDNANTDAETKVYTIKNNTCTLTRKVYYGPVDCDLYPAPPQNPDRKKDS